MTDRGWAWVQKWSCSARLSPGEEDLGCYLPVMDVSCAWLFDWGHRVWVLELFNWSMSDPDPRRPRRPCPPSNMALWMRCVRELRLDETNA